MTELEVLSGPFNIDIHKKTFIDYLEVMLGPDGTIVYAVPSHQEFLILKVMKKYGWTRRQVMEKCPLEQRGWFMEWLITESGNFVPVWRDRVFPWPLNCRQMAALKKLKISGLFHGPLPKSKD